MQHPLTLKAIPFEAIGKPGRRASERERDNAAIELAAYVVAMVKFGGTFAEHEGELMKRANKVRRSQGNGEVVFVAETAQAVHAAADPASEQSAFDATEARLALLMAEGT